MESSLSSILLIAFGKRGYGLMAHNLALSLHKHSPNVPIHIFISEDISLNLTRPELFASINILPTKAYLNNGGRIDPAKVKTQIYTLGRSIGLDKFLYLDVDGLALCDIEPLLQDLNGTTVATEVMGSGGRFDEIAYNLWAKSERTWSHFGLSETATLCGIQSSWMYFEAGRVCDKMQEYLDYYMEVGIPRDMLQFDWGGTVPDELLYQGVFAKMGIVPKRTTGKPVIYFGNRDNVKTESEVKTGYYVLSIYGQGTGKTLTLQRYFAMYERELKQLNAPSQLARIRQDKHLNRGN